MIEPRNIIKTVYLLIGSVFLCSIFSWTSQHLTIGFNGSSSVEGFVFVIVKNQSPKKGQLVAFWPPKNPYYKTWFVKYLKGVAGDEVKFRDREFFINGNYLGKAKSNSKSGKNLKIGTSGIIPKGKMFIWSPHKDSYDSRYKSINWVSTDRIIGTAYRIF